MEKNVELYNTNVRTPLNANDKTDIALKYCCRFTDVSSKSIHVNARDVSDKRADMSVILIFYSLYHISPIVTLCPSVFIAHFLLKGFD